MAIAAAIPWLVGLGRTAAGLTGTRGVAKGAAKIFDPRKRQLREGQPLGSTPFTNVSPTKVGIPRKIQGPRQGIDPRTGQVSVPGRRGQFPNWLAGDTLGASAMKLGLTGLGGSIALDRIGAMMGDDPEEVASPSQTRQFEKDTGQSLPDYSQGIQNRLDYQKKITAKMNKDMKKLIQYYGIVNLVNPDAAPEMLKLGTAMIDQDIKTMGDERQAKIFDSVFANGAPTNAMDAYQRVMQAGGTPEDAEQISGMVADASPTTGGSMTKVEMGQAYIQQAEQAMLNGNDQRAKEIIINAINAGIIPQIVGVGGIKMPAKDQAEKFIEDLGGVNMSSNNSMNIRIKN
jgi:hypothetical protein